MVSGAESIAAMKGDQPVSTVTTPSAATVNDPRSRLTSTIPRATASVGVLAAAATTAGAAALQAAGDPLAVHGNIPLAAFAQITLVGAVIGGVLLAVLNRRSSDPRRRFIQMTIGLTALSCAVPAAFADTGSSKFALVALHLVAAAIIVPVLARHAN
jgi:peptidoglycan/LPS O-acetylase OafA/YrhL